jgi:hypothetical protein
MDENPYQSPKVMEHHDSPFRLAPAGKVLFALAVVIWIASFLDLTNLSNIRCFLAATVALGIAYLLWDVLDLIDFGRGLG